jgi:hypothetical protein
MIYAYPLTPNQNQNQGNNMNIEILTALNTLEEAGIITMGDWLKFRKKGQKLQVKADKEARQTEVNTQVKEALDDIEEGTLFKHRAVWEAVGREAFERDEVLKSLRFWKNELEVQQVRKGPNNFQVFWCRGDEKIEEVVEAVEALVEEA